MYIIDASIYSNDIELLTHELQAHPKLEGLVQLNELFYVLRLFTMMMMMIVMICTFHTNDNFDKGQKQFFLHSIEDDDMSI